MIGDARGIVAGTTHEALRGAFEEAGAVGADSARAVDALVREGSAIGLMLSQELPGLDPDLVQRWAAAGMPILVWLEESPPPAWRGLGAPVRAVTDELTDGDINAWLASLRTESEFGDGLRTLGVLGLGRPVAALAARWAGRLYTLRGPGLLVDADWSGAGLTEVQAAHVWGRAWDFQGPRVVRVAHGKLLPAPPPWDGASPEPDILAALRLHREAPWMVVDLGPDFRRRPALSVLGSLEALAVDAVEAASERVRETVSALRVVNDAVRIGVRGDLAPRVDAVIGLGSNWPAGESRRNLRHEGRRRGEVFEAMLRWGRGRPGRPDRRR